MDAQLVHSPLPGQTKGDDGSFRARKRKATLLLNQVHPPDFELLELGAIEVEPGLDLLSGHHRALSLPVGQRAAQRVHIFELWRQTCPDDIIRSHGRIATR